MLSRPNMAAVIFFLICSFLLNSCNRYSSEKTSAAKTPVYLNLFVDSQEASSSRISNLENAVSYILSGNDTQLLWENEGFSEDTYKILESKLRDKKFETKEAFLKELTNRIGEELVEKHKNAFLEYAYSTIKTLVIDVRRIDKNGVIGAQNESRILFPEQDLNEAPILFLLDPGKVQILAYAYDIIVFENGNFLPSALLEDLRYFISSDVIEIQPEQTQQVELEMQEIVYQKLYAERTTIQKEGENNYRISFDLPAVVGDLSMSLNYGSSHLRHFTQIYKLSEIKTTSRVQAKFHYEILLEDPPVVPHVFGFSIFTENNAEAVRSDTILCPVEVCGPSLPRTRINTIKLLKSNSFSEGVRIKAENNRLNEDAKAVIYASEGKIDQQGLQAIMDQDEQTMQQQKIFGYPIPELVKPHMESEYFIFPSNWETAGSDFLMEDVSYLDFVVFIESLNTGARAYYKKDAGGSAIPGISQIVQTADQKAFTITLGMDLLKSGEIDSLTMPIDIEIYDQEGTLMSLLSEQTATAIEPEKLFLYQAQVDYAANGLSYDKEYYVRIRVDNQASNIMTIRDTAVSQSGGISVETALPVDSYIENSAGFRGTNLGADEYFSIEMEESSKFGLIIYGITPTGTQVFLTPQVLDVSGNSLQGAIANEVMHEFPVPETNTYFIKILKPDLEVTPLNYRLIIEKKMGASASAVQTETITTTLSTPTTLPRTSLDPEDLGMVLISAGTFQMGGNSYSDAPAHTVTISKDFYISDHEVTSAEYRRHNPGDDSHSAGCYDPDCPIVRVKWSHVVNNYLPWLNENFPSSNGNPYRLCTEAEWEYAARAGTTTQWFCGDEPSCLDEFAWHAGNSAGQAHPVKSLKPNPWGLYDMHGNAFEWVWDGFGAYPEAAVTDPTGPETPSGTVDDPDRTDHWLHTLRGGSWMSGYRLSGSAYRYYETHDNKDRYYGVRLCLDI
ncbi:MAG: formylglycine-generating enzyme family protein [SAR324 cluster bacterium]|nr:formylglycine-generating enzyme family protein [SAR324 cluster bacterium]